MAYRNHAVARPAAIAVGAEWVRRRKIRPWVSLAHTIICGVQVRDLLRLLHDDGWYHVRTVGSHRQFRHPGKPGKVTVAGHPSLELHPQTLRSILRQAGLEDRK